MVDVNVTELRRHLPGYLAHARRGQRIRVNTRGKVIAELGPCHASEEDAAARARTTARKPARLRASLRSGYPIRGLGDESLIVVDTHALIWWLAGSPALSTLAKRALRRATAAAPVVASTISVLEIATAVRRGRLKLTVPLNRWLDDARMLPELHFEPVSVEIARVAGAFGGEIHGDPADRLIAATAVALAAPLGTGDVELQRSGAIPTIW